MQKIVLWKIKKSVKYGSENLSISKIQLKTYKAAKTDLIENMIDNLKQRFPDTELQIVHSLSRILNPNRRNVENSDLSTILEHFSDNLSNDEKEIEKELLVLSQFKNQFLHVSSVKQFSGILVANYIDRIPNIAFCAEIYIDLMLASAEAEQVFSDMNRVMTKLCNSMAVSRMSKKILIIRLHRILSKPEIENELNQALAIFLAAKKRRKGLGSLTK